MNAHSALPPATACRSLTPVSCLGCLLCVCDTAWCGSSVNAAVARIQSQENAIAVARVQDAVSELRAQHIAAAKEEERRHGEELAAMRARHADEVATLKQRIDDAKAIGVLSDKVRATASALSHLQEQVAADAVATTQSAHTQLEVRTRLVGEMEENSRQVQQRAAAEARKLNEMLVAMKSTLKKQREAHGADRLRLENEQVRLTHMQVRC